MQDVVFSSVTAVGIAIGFIVTAANAADFQNRGGNTSPRDAAAATSVSVSTRLSVCLSVCLLACSHPVCCDDDACLHQGGIVH